MHYSIKDIPKEERPRERLVEVGVENLSDKELISILLKTGTKDKNVTELALELLTKYSLDELKNCTMKELMSLKGIGIAKSIEFMASIELGKRIFLREKHKLISMTNPEEIWKFSKYLFDGLQQEHFYAFYLNQKQELISKKLLFVGTVNAAMTHPREVFKEAYLQSASYIICLHNHPSNHVSPSQADIVFTKALVETGKIQGIPVLDHIIVGEDTYYSFYEENDIASL